MSRAHGLDPTARARGISASCLAVLLAIGFMGSAAANEPLCLQADGFLRAPDAALADRMGRSIALDGDVVLIGAARHDSGGGQNAGAAYIWRLVAGEWTFEQKLEPDSPGWGGFFGYALDIEGDVAMVGEIGSDEFGYSAGVAHVFERQDGTWTRVQKIAGQGGAPNELFGYAFALDGDRVMIGAGAGADADGVSTGAVYVFERVAGTWTEVQRITPPSGTGARFGASIALSGDTAVIGATTGAAFVYRKPAADWTLEEILGLEDGTSFDQFGVSVSLDGDSVLVGAPGRDLDGEDRGAAYAFERVGDEWFLRQEIRHADAVDEDGFGLGLAHHGGLAVIGAYEKHGDEQRAGAAYVFGSVDGVWMQLAKLESDDPNYRQGYGRAIAIDATSFAITAWRDHLPLPDGGGIIHGGSAEIFTAIAPCPDGDCDGACDDEDNCPTVANEGQADADGDGFGDACEPPPGGGETLIRLLGLADGSIRCTWEELEFPGAHDFHAGDLSALTSGRGYAHEDQLGCWWPPGPAQEDFADPEGEGKARYYLLKSTDVPAKSGQDSNGVRRPDAESRCP